MNPPPPPTLCSRTALLAVAVAAVVCALLIMATGGELYGIAASAKDTRVTSSGGLVSSASGTLVHVATSEEQLVSSTAISELSSDYYLARVRTLKTSLPTGGSISFAVRSWARLNGAVFLFSGATHPAVLVFHNRSFTFGDADAVTSLLAGGYKDKPPGSSFITRRELQATNPQFEAFLAPGNAASCPAGYFTSPDGTDCQGCAAGTFSAVSGATSSAVCQPCAAGSFSSGFGSTACTPCTDFSSECDKVSSYRASGGQAQFITTCSGAGAGPTSTSCSTSPYTCTSTNPGILVSPSLPNVLFGWASGSSTGCYVTGATSSAQCCVYPSSYLTYPQNKCLSTVSRPSASYYYFGYAYCGA